MEWEIVEKKDYKKCDLQLQKKYVTLFLKWKKKCFYVFSKNIVHMHNCCTRVSQIFIQKQEERNLNNNLLAAIIYFFSVTRKLPEKYYYVWSLNNRSLSLQIHFKSRFIKAYIICPKIQCCLYYKWAEMVFSTITHCQGILYRWELSKKISNKGWDWATVEGVTSLIQC